MYLNREDHLDAFNYKILTDEWFELRAMRRYREMCG